MSAAAAGAVSASAAMAIKRRKPSASQGPRKKRRMNPRKRAIGAKRRRPASVGGRKKRRTGIRKGRVPAPTGSTSGDIQYMSRKVGKKPKKSMTDLYRRVNAAIEPCYYRWQGVKNYDEAQGFFLLNRLTSGTVPNAGSTEFLPLYMFNLSAIQGNRAGNAPLVNVGYKLKKQWDPVGLSNPFYICNQILGQNFLGVSGQDHYTRESASASTVTTKSDVLEWIDIRLDCVGPTAIPTKWVIQLVQFMDAYYTPEYQPNNTSVGGAEHVEKEQARTTLYDSWINPFISHPILLQNPKVSKLAKHACKVLWQQDFITQPKESTDLFTSGQEKIIKIFKWMHRTQDYDWSETGRMPAVGVGAVETPGFALNTGGDFVNDVHYSKKLYLVVKAQSHTVNDSTTAKCPSFDLVIRKKHLEDVL